MQARITPQHLFINALGADESGHVFLLMHHMLWWKEDAPWWAQVHPLLLGTNVRAVFAGDYGPMKFSHLRRDAICQ